MAKLLFRLNDVPLDEAIAVRQLLAEHDYDVYETHAGMFGFAVAGIWLKDSASYDTARRLLDDFAAERSEAFRQGLAGDSPPSFWQHVGQRPMLFLLSLFSIGAVLGVSLWPFLRFAN